MATPLDKNPVIEDFINSFARGAFGRERTQSIKDNICTTCGEPAIEFEDELSKREYEISGMCQKCQNKVFDGEE